MVCVGGLRRKSSTLCFCERIGNPVDDIGPPNDYTPNNFFMRGSINWPTTPATSETPATMNEI